MSVKSLIIPLLDKYSPIFNKYNYTITNVMEPQLNKMYGIISILRIDLNTDTDNNLVVIPGYSDKSFFTMFEKLLEGFEYVETKYKSIYIINWGQTIKDLSQKIIKDISNVEEEYAINEDFRIKLAIVLDKILRSPLMNLYNITLLGKSAGGGIAIHLASILMQVKELLLCCPASNMGGKPVKHRIDLSILLSWNKDDTIIPFTNCIEFEKDFKAQHNIYKIFVYENGGHELNVEFLKNIF